MPVLVMAKLGWNFKRDIFGLASIFFYFFEATRPQIRIGVAQTGSTGKVSGLVHAAPQGRESKKCPHARSERCAHNDKHKKMPHVSVRHRKKIRPGGPRLIWHRLYRF